MRSKILAMLEVLLVFAVSQAILIVWRSTSIAQWEKQNLGWSYSAMLFFLGIPAVVIWLTRRNWAEYGVSLVQWQTNLDIGIKAFVVQFIPLGIGVSGAALMKLDTNGITGGIYIALMEIAGLAVMLWVLNRHKPVKSGRRNSIVTLLLLLFPILLAIAMRSLSILIISTVVWQFIFSGFGEEFIFRGYYQSRLNQVFGRPMRLFGIQFGAGLIIASLLFGLLHAFNTYDPAIGLSSFSWGWALWTSLAGLFFGVIREKTGSLVAPGIAHGLPDAVGEAMKIIFGWV